MPSVTIAARFNGPPGSANGGYACGCLASHVRGPAEVRLIRPPPLDRPLVVHRDADAWRLDDAGEDVARGRSIALEWNAPVAPSLDEARRAQARYAGFEAHAYPTCFVCGPERAPGDGLRLFPGALADRDAAACVWSPSEEHRTSDGLDPTIVWAALDCPSFFGLQVDFSHPFLLGQMSADLAPGIPGDRDLVVYAWRTGGEGRKHYAASALADGEGRVWARAEHVWFDMKPKLSPTSR